MDLFLIEVFKVMGMNLWRWLIKVEFFLVFFVIMVGICIVMVFIIGIVIIVVFIGVGGFGSLILFGIDWSDNSLILLGVILVVLLVFIFDGILWMIEYLVKEGFKKCLFIMIIVLIFIFVFLFVVMSVIKSDFVIGGKIGVE